MARADTAQMNIRSVYARERVREIARGTGMSVTEIVEDALRGYVPPAEREAAAGLVRRGAVLVKPAAGRQVSQAQAEDGLQATREREL